MGKWKKMTDDIKKELAAIVDNGTTHITIKTPKGWKCDRKGCNDDYLHTHGTYQLPPTTI